MRKAAAFAFAFVVLAGAAAAQPAEGIPRTLLPLSLLQEIIHEASGDLAFQNEMALAGVYRNRLPEEYAKGYFEPEFILNKLREYGIKDARIIDLQPRNPLTWDAEMGELWIVSPNKRKIADLKEVPASLCSGSATLDLTGELVYVGPGNRDTFYEGRDVKGKFVLVNGSPGGAQRIAVEKLGALGVVAYGSSHAEYDPDEVGWSSISNAEGMKPSLGFMVSTRQGNDLRDMLERGAKISVRGVAKTQMVPYKDQMVEAVIPGAVYPEEELVFTAHLYEMGPTKQGANDNISGCVSILETARVLRKLMDEGKIPPLKRTVRFLFIPEMSGTSAYLRLNPDIVRRFFANINQDMVGEGLIKNQSVFELVQSPPSIPSYLNDVMRAFTEWVGTTQRNGEGKEAYLPIWSPNGSRDPFYYVIDPYSGGSDHVVFVGSGLGIPAVMMIVWPDQWYHTNRDTVDKSDPTQLKRVIFIGAAAAITLAGAGPAEAERMIPEVAMRCYERIGQAKAKAVRAVLEAGKEKLTDAYRDADNALNQAFLRQEDILNSIRFFIRGDAELETLLKAQVKAVDDMRVPADQELAQIYQARCRKEGVVPVRTALTAEEIRAGKLVPVRTDKMKAAFDSQGFAARRREAKDLPAYQLGGAETVLRNMLDGKRSVLQLRNAAAAEVPGVTLQNVENWVMTLEKLGYVTIIRR
jgi:aminopeptidase YwaD